MNKKYVTTPAVDSDIFQINLRIQPTIIEDDRLKTHTGDKFKLIVWRFSPEVLLEAKYFCDIQD